MLGVLQLLLIVLILTVPNNVVDISLIVVHVRCTRSSSTWIQCTTHNMHVTYTTFVRFQPVFRGKEESRWEEGGSTVFGGSSTLLSKNRSGGRVHPGSVMHRYKSGESSPVFSYLFSHSLLSNLGEYLRLVNVEVHAAHRWMENATIIFASLPISHHFSLDC